MEYRYNAERDRLATVNGSTYYLHAEYENTKTHEKYDTYLHDISGHAKSHEVTAQKNKPHNMNSFYVSRVQKREYADWLLGGKDHITVGDTVIPANFVVDYVTADGPETVRGVGNREKEKKLIAEKDPEYFAKILDSFEKTKPDKDVIRVAEDPEYYEMDDLLF
jgi:hypothetical protein